MVVFSSKNNKSKFVVYEIDVRLILELLEKKLSVALGKNNWF